MRLRNVSNKISRIGGRISKGSERAFGKVEKGVMSAERGVQKGIAEVEKAADSKVVRGVQQGLGVGGRLLTSTGVPQLQAAGGALLAGQQAVKEGRKAIKASADVARDKLEYAKKGDRTIAGRIRGEAEVNANKNMLERPKATKEDNGINYV